MINTMDVAIDLVTGRMDTCELVDSVDFLVDVDNSLKTLFDKNLYSGTQIANKRKQILNRITILKEKENELIEEW